MEKKEKEKIVADLKERLGRANGVFLVDYQGLKVEVLTKLRRELREADIDFKVVKNRLLSLACENTETGVLKERFGGPSALAITYDDVIMPAKILTKFSQENEALEVKVGHISGSILEVLAIKKLAQLPAREVLLAQLVFSLASIPTHFVRTLSEMLRSLVTVLDAIKKEKE